MFLILWTAWRWRKAPLATDKRTFDLMFAAAIVVSLVTGMHMFTHDLSPLMLAMLLVAAHFPTRDRPQLRVLVGATLAIFWIPPVYFALVAWHCMYLLFPILMVFAAAATILVGRPIGPSTDATEAASR